MRPTSAGVHALELVGLKLRVEIGAVVDIHRHRVDIATGADRHRQARQRPKTFFKPVHHMRHRPAVRHAARADQRLQRRLSGCTQNFGALAAQFGDGRGRSALTQRRFVVVRAGHVRTRRAAAT
jgi:hypothetical protein